MEKKTQKEFKRQKKEYVGNLSSKHDMVTHRNYDYLNNISVRLDMSVFCHRWGWGVGVGGEWGVGLLDFILP